MKCAYCGTESLHTEDACEGMQLCQECLERQAIRFIKTGRAGFVQKQYAEKLAKQGKVSPEVISDYWKKVGR